MKGLLVLLNNPDKKYYKIQRNGLGYSFLRVKGFKSTRVVRTCCKNNVVIKKI